MALISLRCPKQYGNIKMSCLHYTNLLEVSVKKEPISIGCCHRKCAGSCHRKCVTGSVSSEIVTGNDYRKCESDEEFIELNKINLYNFFRNTTTPYVFFQCKLQSIDCRFLWTVRRTLLGSCIMLNPQASISLSMFYFPKII